MAQKITQKMTQKIVQMIFMLSNCLPEGQVGHQPLGHREGPLRIRVRQLVDRRPLFSRGLGVLEEVLHVGDLEVSIDKIVFPPYEEITEAIQCPTVAQDDSLVSNFWIPRRTFNYTIPHLSLESKRSNRAASSKLTIHEYSASKSSCQK